MQETTERENHKQVQEWNCAGIVDPSRLDDFMIALQDAVNNILVDFQSAMEARPNEDISIEAIIANEVKDGEWAIKPVLYIDIVTVETVYNFD